MSWLQTRFERSEHREPSIPTPWAPSRLRPYFAPLRRESSPVVLHSLEIFVRHHRDTDSVNNADDGHGDPSPPILPDVFVDPQSLDTPTCLGRTAAVGCFVCFEALPVVALRCGHVMCGACYARWAAQAGYVCWMCRQRVAGSLRIFLEAGPPRTSGVIEETNLGGPDPQVSPETLPRPAAVSLEPTSHLAFRPNAHDERLSGPPDCTTFPDTDGPRAAN